jgi:hypothetical protein
VITAKIDQKALDRYLKTLDKNHGKPLLQRAENTAFAGAGLLRDPLRAEMPSGPSRRIAGGPVRPGNLKRRVRTKRLGKRGGEDIRPTWVGSTAFYDRWLRMGTSRHSIAPREAGSVLTVTKWSGRSFNVTTKGKSPYAAFADGNVRAMTWDVSGVTANPYHTRVAESHGAEIKRLFEKNVYAVR